MLVKYCSNCGKKTTFELEAPNYCPKCGRDMNAALKIINSSSSCQQHQSKSNNYSINSDLRESDEIDYSLINQIKANMSRQLQGIDITVENIPEFRVPMNQIINTKE